MARGTPPSFVTHGTGALEKGTKALILESACPTPAGLARETALVWTSVWEEMTS